MFAWRTSWPDGLSIAFSDREGGVTPGAMGSLNLGRSDVDAIDHVAENFRRLGTAIGASRFIVTHQVHGTEVLRADEHFLDRWPAAGHLGTDGGQPSLPVADAIVTTRADCGTGTALLVRVADCLPVVLVDEAHQVIAVAHAGRAGLLAGVLPEVVAAMRDAGATQIRAWIGPHVCGACYEVPTGMATDAWQRLPGTRATTSWGTTAIDLAGGAVDQLAQLKVPATDLELCTLQRPELHSHRRDGAQSGRSVGAIWFAEPRDAPS